MKILYLLDFYPFDEDFDGGSKQFYNIIKYSSFRADVDILLVNTYRNLNTTPFFGVKNVYKHDIKINYFQKLYYRCIFKPYALSNNQLNNIYRKFNLGKYSIIHASKFLFYNFKKMHPHFLLSIGDSDSENIFLNGSIKNLLRFYYWRVVEMKLSSQNYWMTFVSSKDSNAFFNKEKHFILHNGVDFYKYRPVNFRETKIQNSFAFHGVLDYEPNTDCIIYMSKILQLIAPLSKLYIIGRMNRLKLTDLKKLFNKMKNVELVGPVNDISIEISKYQFYLILMPSGSGIKNKLIEALSTGCIILANERALNGLICHDELLECIYLIKDPKDILNAMNDKNNWDLKSANAVSYIKKYYSWNSYIEQLFNIYSCVLS